MIESGLFRQVGFGESASGVLRKEWGKYGRKKAGDAHAALIYLWRENARLHPLAAEKVDSYLRREPNKGDAASFVFKELMRKTKAMKLTASAKFFIDVEKG
jgi:hypothetical protein